MSYCIVYILILTTTSFIHVRYDAVMLYAEADFPAARIILEKLENLTNPGYSLCIKDRDYILGEDIGN